jgi:hypothetical protein
MKAFSNSGGMSGELLYFQAKKTARSFRKYCWFMPARGDACTISRKPAEGVVGGKVVGSRVRFLV